MNRIGLFVVSCVSLSLLLNEVRVSAAGGEVCKTATEILSLPYQDVGDTCLPFAQPDYTAVCPSPSPSSGDLVYQYTPTASGCIDVSLCSAATLYDANVYVFAQGLGGCPPAGESESFPHACSDDTSDCFDPTLPVITGIPVNGGETYWIVVDGSNEQCGLYELLISDCPVAECVTNADCNDGDPCTGDVCLGGTCASDPATPEVGDTCRLLEPGTWNSPHGAPSDCSQDDYTSTDGSVYAHSGEFHQGEVDLRVRSRGLEFVWSRTYRSRTGADTSMGNGWSHSYDIRIEPVGPNLVLHGGNGRSDAFFQDEPGVWKRDEFFHVLSEGPAGPNMVLSFPDQSEWQFHGFEGLPTDGKLATIRDRFSNTMTFGYDTSGNLTTISDPLSTVDNQRAYTVGYTPEGRVASVTDFAGRQLTYDYYEDGEVGGSAGDLKSVTSPPVVGTPNGNDFPAGKTTTYTYTTGFADERLNHDLLTITDPKGQTYLTNEYAHTRVAAVTDPLDPLFDHVVRQNFSADDPRYYVYSYLPVAPAPENGGAVQMAIINDPKGHVTELFIDDRNRPTVQRVYTGQAVPDQATTDTANRPAGPLRASDPSFFETRFEFNNDSLLTRQVFPGGNSVALIYDDANLDRAARANVLQVCRDPGPLGGDQTQLCEQFTYEPGFGGCGMQARFVRDYTDSGGLTTTYAYDTIGTLTRTTHRVPTIVEDFEYNAFGQITLHTLPENGSGQRRVDRFSYYDPTDGAQNGFLKSERVDDVGLGLATTYEYDSIGRMTRSIDARGNDSLFTYNALDQMVRRSSRAVDSAAGGIRYESDLYYDANDNVVRECQLNVDEAGVVDPSNSYFTVIFEYNTWADRMTRMCRETGSFDVPRVPPKLDCEGLPASEFLVTEYEYDSVFSLTKVNYGEGASGGQADNDVTRSYDERDLIFKSTRAAGGSASSTTQYDYDPNGLLTVSGFGLESTPRETRYRYDGYDRLTSFVDPNGNEERYTYDPRGNAITIRGLGEHDDLLGDAGNLRLGETTYEYDNMDRLTRTVTEHFDSQTQAPILDGTSTTTHSYTGTSQLKSTTDDNNNTSTFTYDSANRITLVGDAFGNTTHYTYDPNSNVITLRSVDLPTLPLDPQEFETTYEYDSLDRLTRKTDNVGNAWTYGFDSRGNNVTKTDPDGRTSRSRYDGMSRLLAEIYDMDGNGASDSDSSDIVLRYAWDDSCRLTANTDDLGNVTRYEYDSLNRMTRETMADSTERTYGYDVFDDRASMVDPNGNAMTYEYDAISRLTRVTVFPGAGVSTDTTGETYRYDGLSRLKSASDDDSAVTFEYDSLSRILRESLNGRTTTSLYDGVGNQLSCVYPGQGSPPGRSVSYEYDSLNRMTRVSDPVDPVASFDYIGTSRKQLRLLGNNTVTTYAYDGVSGIPNSSGDFGVRQIIGMNHASLLGSTIDDRRYLWDSMYNKVRREKIPVIPTDVTTTYEYDPIYRLTRSLVTGTDGTTIRDTGYSLDGAGNRLEVTGGENAGPYVLDSALPVPGDLQMHQYTRTPSDARSYDANGNLTGAQPTGGPPEALQAPAPDAIGSEVPKQRFITMVVPGSGAGRATALRVRLVSLYHPRLVLEDTPDFSEFEGQLRYVNAFRDPATGAAFFDCLDSPSRSTFFKCASLGCEPEYRDWSAILAGEPLHVTGPAVLPDSEYGAAQLSAGCAGTEATCGDASTELAIATSPYGDADGGGVANVFDVVETVDKVKDLATALSEPRTLRRLPALDPATQSVNVTDIVLNVDAVKSVPYSLSGPIDCALPPAPVFNSIQYDYRDQMVGFVEGSTGVLHTYSYDALGRRFRRVTNSNTTPEETRYLYDGWRVVEEQDAIGATESTYVYGTYIDEILHMRRGGSDYYFHGDDIFNVVAATDSSGQVVERYEYDDFGRITVRGAFGAELPGSTIGNPYGFTGRRLDPETGLYYYRTRYYDPRAGRFTSRDPQGIWGDETANGNPYVYAGNNPVTYGDPFGLTKEKFVRDKPHLNIGTIGHVDHGGTTLTSNAMTLKGMGCGEHVVQCSSDVMGALEGKSTRGSFDPGPNKLIAVRTETMAHVDCPGHADYVKNMSSVGPATPARKKVREIVVVGSKVKDVVRSPGYHGHIPGGSGGGGRVWIGALMDDRRWRSLHSNGNMTAVYEGNPTALTAGCLRRSRGGMACKTKHDTAKNAINNVRAAAGGAPMGEVIPTLEIGMAGPLKGKVFPKVEIFIAASRKGTIFPKIEWPGMGREGGVQFCDAWPCKWKPWISVDSPDIGGIQNESRKFQTLSNASKARHDAAMNSVRNFK